MARLFYLENKSKIEIAEEFGISRFKVARMLENAIRDGLIRLEIHLPAELDADLSDALRTRFDLTHAIVFTSPEQGPGGEGPAPVTRRLGAVAADLLTEIVTEGDVLGLVWGPEIEAMCPELTALPRCTVVQLSGVAPLRPIDVNAVEAVRRTAFVARGIAYPIYAPLLLPDGAAARMLRQQPGIAEAIGQFNRVTKAVITVGAWDQDSPPSTTRSASANNRATGVKGDVPKSPATSSMRRAGSSPRNCRNASSPSAWRSCAKYPT